jgi:hypothetical protein
MHRLSTSASKFLSDRTCSTLNTGKGKKEEEEKIKYKSDSEYR